jgi:hypothetical protein
LKHIQIYAAVQDKFISTLLVIGLILAQLVIGQHALDLASHADDEPCELCMLSAGLDQALGPERAFVEPQPPHSLASTWQVCTDLAPVTPTFLARAPPFDLLPI